MWNYYMPTRIVSGEGLLKQDNSSFPINGCRALIVTGRHSARACGALADMEMILAKNKVAWRVFDGVEENPSFDTVRKASKIAINDECDLVIAIGGGSPMDAAKAVAVLGSNPSLTVEELYNSSSYHSALPVVAISTTSGTGSEVTQYSVLTDDSGNKRGFGSPLIFPQIAVLDPEYTLTMNDKVTVATALDALSHSIEGEILNGGNNPLVKMLSRKATADIRRTLGKSLADLRNIVYRSELQQAASFAGIVIAHSGTTVVHAVGYPLSSGKKVRHGIANSMFMIDVLERISLRFPDRVANAIEPFADLGELREFYSSFGIYDMRVEITDKEIEDWASKSLAAPHNKKTPGDFDMEFYTTLYEKVRAH